MKFRNIIVYTLYILHMVPDGMTTSDLRRSGSQYTHHGPKIPTLKIKIAPGLKVLDGKVTSELGRTPAFQTTPNFYDPSFGFSQESIAPIFSSENTKFKGEPVLSAVLLNSKDYYQLYNKKSPKVFDKDKPSFGKPGFHLDTELKYSENKMPYPSVVNPNAAGYRYEYKYPENTIPHQSTLVAHDDSAYRYELKYPEDGISQHSVPNQEAPYRYEWKYPDKRTPHHSESSHDPAYRYVYKNPEGHIPEQPEPNQHTAYRYEWKYPDKKSPTHDSGYGRDLKYTDNHTPYPTSQANHVTPYRHETISENAIQYSNVAQENPAYGPEINYSENKSPYMTRLPLDTLYKPESGNVDSYLTSDENFHRDEKKLELFEPNLPPRKLVDDRYKSYVKQSTQIPHRQQLVEDQNIRPQQSSEDFLSPKRPDFTSERQRNLDDLLEESRALTAQIQILKIRTERELRQGVPQIQRRGRGSVGYLRIRQ